MAFQPGLVVRTRVKVERADDFERWVDDALAILLERVADAPEVQWFREWRVSERPSETVSYILFAAGSDLSALDLEPLLVQAYGPERARVELAEFEGMLDGEQDAWSLQPLTPSNG